MCLCQVYGKSGVPNERGHCLVCGEQVWTELPRPEGVPLQALFEAPAEVRDALPEPLRGPCVEDRCTHCDRLIGLGIPLFHLGVCDECAAQGKTRKEH